MNPVVLKSACGLSQALATARLQNARYTTVALKNIVSKGAPILAVAALTWGSAVIAQVPLPPPSNALKTVAPNEAVSLPAIKTAGAVEYVSGGIPYEQLPAFRQARRDYSLNVEIFQREGGRSVFTADAAVQLINVKSGEVLLETKTDGPYLWVKVPPGQYKVVATLSNHMKESRVTVSGSAPKRVVIVFPQAED